MNQSKGGYGLVEGLAAIFIYLSTGYLSVAGSYCYINQTEKREIVKDRVSQETWNLIQQTRKNHSQPPDLFIYSPENKDYFFCEVKGPGDKIRDSQDEYFFKLKEISGAPIYLITFKNAPIDF